MEDTFRDESKLVNDLTLIHRKTLGEAIPLLLPTGKTYDRRRLEYEVSLFIGTLIILEIDSASKSYPLWNLQACRSAALYRLSDANASERTEYCDALRCNLAATQNASFPAEVLSRILWARLGGSTDLDKGISIAVCIGSSALQQAKTAIAHHEYVSAAVIPNDAWVVREVIGDKKTYAQLGFPLPAYIPEHATWMTSEEAHWLVDRRSAFKITDPIWSIMGLFLRVMGSRIEAIPLSLAILQHRGRVLPAYRIPDMQEDLTTEDLALVEKERKEGEQTQPVDVKMIAGLARWLALKAGGAPRPPNLRLSG